MKPEPITTTGIPSVRRARSSRRSSIERSVRTAGSSAPATRQAHRLGTGGQQAAAVAQFSAPGEHHGVAGDVEADRAPGDQLDLLALERTLVVQGDLVLVLFAAQQLLGHRGTHVGHPPLVGDQAGAPFAAGLAEGAQGGDRGGSAPDDQQLVAIRRAHARVKPSSRNASVPPDSVSASHGSARRARVHRGGGQRPLGAVRAPVHGDQPRARGERGAQPLEGRVQFVRVEVVEDLGGDDELERAVGQIGGNRPQADVGVRGVRDRGQMGAGGGHGGRRGVERDQPATARSQLPGEHPDRRSQLERGAERTRATRGQGGGVLVAFVGRAVIAPRVRVGAVARLEVGQAHAVHVPRRASSAAAPARASIGSSRCWSRNSSRSRRPRSSCPPRANGRDPHARAASSSSSRQAAAIAARACRATAARRAPPAVHRPRRLGQPDRDRVLRGEDAARAELLQGAGGRPRGQRVQRARDGAVGHAGPRGGRAQRIATEPGLGGDRARPAEQLDHGQIGEHHAV